MKNKETKGQQSNIKKEESAYDPEFVKKILQGREDVKNGKGVKIKIEDLWK